MKPQLLTVGESQSRIVVIDDISGAVERVREIAAAMTPFPPAENHYPGVRRRITAGDRAAHAYVEHLLQAAAPFIGQAFGFARSRLLEAGFSMVTMAPDQLSANQRAPHFDDTAPDYLALLHYLGPASGTGTAFYRHRATGIERVTAGNVDALTAILKLESLSWRRTGYITGSDAFFEQIGQIDSRPDRLVVYQGSLLHSGIIPPDMRLSDDPRTGRLTANLFLRGHM
jgi:hypothetical protein